MGYRGNNRHLFLFSASPLLLFSLKGFPQFLQINDDIFAYLFI